MSVKSTGGDPNPVYIRKEDAGDDWKHLKKIAALDGDASSVSEADLRIAADPNMRIDGDRTLTANDLVVPNQLSGAERISKNPEQANRTLEALASHMPSSSGVNIKRTSTGRVLNLQLKDTPRPEGGMTAPELNHFRITYASTRKAEAFNSGAEQALRHYSLHPETVETVTLNANDRQSIQRYMAAGYYPVTQKTETRTLEGNERVIGHETMNASLGDLYATGAYAPSQQKLTELTGQLEAMRRDGYTLSGINIHSGTDAQTVGRPLFDKMANEFLFSGKLEELGYACPYLPAVSYDDIRAATTPDQKKALLDRLYSLEQDPSAELRTRYGDVPFNGNLLLGYARNAEVRAQLIGKPELGLTPASFAEPTIRPGVANPKGGNQYNEARHTSLTFERGRDITDIEQPTSVTETTYTLARFDPLHDIKPKVVVAFDESGSISVGEKALFLQSLLESLSSQDFEQVEFRVCFLEEAGLTGEEVTFHGTPEEVVTQLAQRVIPERQLNVGTGTVLQAVDRLAAQGSDGFDDTMGETGRAGSRTHVASRMTALRDELGGPNRATVIVYTDIDARRTQGLEAPPFRFKVYNPALN